MVVQVTCAEITGRTRDELTSLLGRAMARPIGAMSDDQEEAAKQLVEAFASFVEAGVTPPEDIRLAVTDLVLRPSAPATDPGS